MAEILGWILVGGAVLSILLLDYSVRRHKRKQEEAGEKIIEYIRRIHRAPWN